MKKLVLLPIATLIILLVSVSALAEDVLAEPELSLETELFAQAQEAMETELSGNHDAPKDKDLLGDIDYDKLEQLVINLTSRLGDLDYEKLQEDIKLVQAVMGSESFRHLLTYEEVRDFADYSLKMITRFALDEPELLEKILITMELDQASVTVIMEVIDFINTSDLDVETFDSLNTAVTEMTGLILENPETLDKAAQVIEAMKNKVLPASKGLE